MKITTIIPAAGVGKRFTDSVGDLGKQSKIEMDLAGQPVFMRSIELFVKHEDVGQIILAVNPNTIDEFKFRWGDKLGFHDIKVVPGGTKERWETVLKALQAIEDDVTHVAVHDAARPLASRKLIDRVIEAARQFNAVVPGLPVASTLKRVAPDDSNTDEPIDPLDAILGAQGKPTYTARRVIETVDRSDLVEIQTPQLFEVGLLRQAYARIADGSLDPAGVTDDASLIEAMGEPVHVVEGESINIKITRSGDLELASAIVKKRVKKESAELGRKRLFGAD